jgi:hypothetical protein
VTRVTLLPSGSEARSFSDHHRFKARYDRPKPEPHSQAVEKAAAKVRKRYESAETKRVKRTGGRIEDWVRDLVVELVTLDRAKVPQVIGRVRCSLTQMSGEKRDSQGGDDGENQTIINRSVQYTLNSTLS